MNLQLTDAEIDALAEAIRLGILPPTNGFFFSTSDGSETDDDLRFVATAREAFAAGRSVFFIVVVTERCGGLSLLVP